MLPVVLFCISKFRIHLHEQLTIIISYVDERVTNLISSLTNWNVPKMDAFRHVDEVSITIATQNLFNINSKTVRDLANKFVPTDAKDMISKGLTVMHTLPVTSGEVKDENQQVSISIPISEW